jgi:hypothetical protein
MSISRLAPNTSTILRSTQEIATIGDVLMAVLLFAIDVQGASSVELRLASDLALECVHDGSSTLEGLRAFAAELSQSSVDMFAQSTSPLAHVVAAAE